MKRGKAPTDCIAGRSYPIRVTITPEDFQRMTTMSRLSSPNEVGGVAMITDNGETLHVHTPELLTQTVSGGEVDLAADEVLAWLISKFGRENINCAMPNATFCFWHSHPNFNTFFSGQDERWINTYVNQGWLVSICVNNNNRYAVRVDSLVGGSSQKNALWLHCDTELDFHFTLNAKAIKAECEPLFKSKVKKAKFKVVGGRQGSMYPFPGHGAYPVGFDFRRKGSGPIAQRRENLALATGQSQVAALMGDDEAWEDWRTIGSNNDTPDDKGPLDRTLLISPEDGLYVVKDDDNEEAAEMDPCEYREFLSGYEDHPETPMLVKSLREAEIQNLRDVRKGFTNGKHAAITVTFNLTGSVTITQGKATRVLTPTKACITLLRQRLGVSAKWIRDQLSTGTTLRTDGARKLLEVVQSTVINEPPNAAT